MKKRTFDLIAVDELTIYTGSNGKNGCTCQCPGCSQTIYGVQNRRDPHQGTLQQIEELIPLLPNLKKAYFLGNPDCSVDPKFCNAAAKLFISKGIHVMFSTSGIGGKATMQTLLSKLDLNFVDYVSFSIDSTNPETESILKGRKVNYSNLLKGIEYCRSLGVTVKIQPTIWQLNEDHCINLLDFFHSKYSIDWFTFHVGSLEGLLSYTSPICKHVTPDKWHDTVQKILDFGKQHKLKVAVPMVFLNEEEYAAYQTSYIPHCMNPKPTNLQVWLEEKTRFTFYPILGGVYPTAYTGFLQSEIVASQPENSGFICPVQAETLGSELEKQFSQNRWENNGQIFYCVCRYYKKMT